MFLDANNHSLSSRGQKITYTLPEETVTYIYPTMRKIHWFSFAFHSVNAFKSVRRLRATLFFVLSLNTLISVKPRRVLYAPASQYPRMLLVVNHIYLIREYTVLIGDPNAVKILTHNPSLSYVPRYSVAFEDSHAPKLAVINRTCHVHLLQELLRTATACSIATQAAYGTVRI